MKNIKNKGERVDLLLRVFLGVFLVIISLSFNSAQHINLDNASYVFVFQITGSNLTLDNSTLIDGEETYVFQKYNFSLRDILLINSSESENYLFDSYIYNSTNFTAVLNNSDGSQFSLSYFDPALRYFIWEPNFTSWSEAENYSVTKDVPVVLNYSSSLNRLTISLNDTVLFEYKLPENTVCNNNGICENTYNGNISMFESYETCPTDCKFNAYDYICNVNTSVSEYSYNDGICDPDCSADSSGGECTTLPISCVDVNPQEQCNPNNILRNCSSFGYKSGSISCTSYCTFNTSSCSSVQAESAPLVVILPSSSPVSVPVTRSTGGGGGGGSIVKKIVEVVSQVLGLSEANVTNVNESQTSIPANNIVDGRRKVMIISAFFVMIVALILLVIYFIMGRSKADAQNVSPQ